MLSSLLAFSLTFGASAVAQQSSFPSSSSVSVVCIAGQCLEGSSNTTIGALLSAPGASTSLHLLPDQYSSTTNPELLSSLLTTSSATLSPSAGFANSTSISLPLDLDVQPGLVAYSSPLYSGQASFSQLPTSPSSNTSTSLSAASLALSSNVWAAVNAGSNNRVILWNSIPDVTQLPSTAAGSLSLLDIESNTCSPPCSGNGVCTTNGTCTCPSGFSGTSCESCSAGFFGSSCQACPSGCTDCDDGINGSGRCLSTQTANATACNCINGACSSNGQCTCNAGWTTASNGTACAQCEPGFFLTSDGDCQICQLGCSQCADGTGDCTTCKSGFTQDANDRTKCDPPQQTDSSGAVCPDGSFDNSGTCKPCSSSCSTCTGATSNDCIQCSSGSFSFNGSCVTTDSNGVCEGTGGLIANNNNHECDTCGAKCTSCAISGFSVASTIDQLQCTGCLPGFVLSDGKCLESCPSGTFLSPTDNLTCEACDSSCSTCAGATNFCLTCGGSQLASNGQCVSTCPSNTFSSSGACLPCHPDCASCSGGAFNQCSTCNANRPVLTSGRCLPTCGPSQFFDKTTSSCQSCDSSCASCSSSGANNCLACATANQVLRNGACVSATCTSNTSVIPGLGVCLSDLVVVPQASGTSSITPLPTITGIDQPTTINSSRRPLAWWEILLMALGCAFIFLVFMMCWRRRMRKKRAAATKQFARAKAITQKGSWRWRLVRFGERLFGHRPSHIADVETGEDSEALRLMRLRDSEEERHHREMEKIISAYEHSTGGSRHGGSARGHSPLPSLHSNRLSDASLYSTITGQPRRGPDPRQPVREPRDPRSRFSNSTLASASTHSWLKPPVPTPAEEYAHSVRDQNSPGGPGDYWIKPTPTGGSKNPFRR